MITYRKSDFFQLFIASHDDHGSLGFVSKNQGKVQALCRQLYPEGVFHVVVQVLENRRVVFRLSDICDTLTEAENTLSYWLSDLVITEPNL